MPETKAEDDDEEGFGDFKFASFPNLTVHSDHINGRNSTTTDDDEWGDFVEYPLRSVLSSDFPLNQSPPIPNPSEPTKHFDPLGFISDHSTKPSDSVATRIESVSSRVDSGKNQWVKPKGALPLSIFGDVEDEDEQSGMTDPPVGDFKPSVADKHVGNVRNGSNVNLGGVIDDIIANLNSQNQQIKAENGSNSNGLSSSVDRSYSNLDGVNLNMNGSMLNLSGLNTRSDLAAGNKDFDVISDLFNQSKQIKSANLLNSKSNEFGSEISLSTSNLSLFDLNFNGLNSESDFLGRNDFNGSAKVINSNSDLLGGNEEPGGDDDGWEFKDAYSEWNVRDGNAKVINSNPDLLGGNVESNGDDDGWEFKEAYTEANARDGNAKEHVVSEQWGLQVQPRTGQEVQVDKKGQVDLFSSDFGNGSQGTIDFFAEPNEFPSKSSEMGIGFDSKPLTATQNGFSLDSYFKNENNSKENGLNYDLSMKKENRLPPDPVVGSVDLDESFGEFEYAFSETGPKQEEEPKVNNLSHSEVDVFTFDGKIQGNESRSENKGPLPLSIFGDGGLETDASLNSQDIMHRPTSYPRNGIHLHLQGSNISINDLISNLYSQAEKIGSTQKPSEDGPDATGAIFDSNLVNGDDDFDDGSWEFKDSTQKPSEGGLDATGTVFGSNMVNGDDDFDDGSWEFKDSTQKPSEDGLDATGTVFDSNLVNGDDDFDDGSWEFKDSTQKPFEDGLDATGTVFDSNLVNGDDDFDDGSWEFKDASSQNGAKDQTSILSHGDGSSNKLKLNNYVDFYCKLKDELYFSARCRLDSLEKARTTAALSGDDAKVVALDEEIQEVCKELHQENRISKEVYSEDHPARDISLNEFLQVLREPKFQLLESEYHLSRKLQLAEKDMRSMIELLKHVTSVLNVLTLGSMEEQSNYVSTWSKTISVCAQELKHGARIWKQSLEENVRSQIFSDPRGKQFILALGEVYRVVVVIGASVKLYKPWIILNSVDSTNIYALLEECYTLWSSSGLEEALQSIYDPIGIDYDGTVEALLESIKHIYDLDGLALGSHVFSQQEPLCHLSALTPETIPDIKMVEWNGEHYFLTLANLWANMISCDPPKLPHLHVGR